MDKLTGDKPRKTGQIYTAYDLEEQVEEFVFISLGLIVLKHFSMLQKDQSGQHCVQLPYVGRWGGQISPQVIETVQVRNSDDLNQENESEEALKETEL